MSFEQARALFPVLERIAYLNAGTFGPLATPTTEAMRAELERDSDEGRTGMPYFERALELRDRGRAAIAGLIGADPAHVALTSSTTDGCNIVLAGLGLGLDDEVVTTTDEHFGLLGPLGASRARIVVVEPDPDRILAAVTPRTRLLALSEVLWTTGRVLPVSELRAAAACPCSSTALSRSARSRYVPRGSTFSRCRARSGCADRMRRERCSSRSPTLARRGPEPFLPGCV